MNKYDFGKHLYNNFIIVGSNSFEMAKDEIKRLNLSKNLLIDRFDKNISQEKVYRNLIIKELKRNGILSFRENNTFYTSNLKDLIENDEIKLGYNSIVLNMYKIIEREKIELGNVEGVNGIIAGAPEVKVLNKEGNEVNIIYLAIGKYKSICNEINESSSKAINYLILEEDFINKYSPVTLKLGIKYKYVVYNSKLNESLIFNNWIDIDEWIKNK